MKYISYVWNTARAIANAMEQSVDKNFQFFLFVWQEDLCSVVHFISECFALRGTILNSEEIPPSYQPVVAGQM